MPDIFFLQASSTELIQYSVLLGALISTIFWWSFCIDLINLGVGAAYKVADFGQNQPVIGTICNSLLIISLSDIWFEIAL